MKRPDRPLVPPECRRRPHVDAFADLTPIDKSTLIERSQLLDAIADDDDIEWKTDPFEMRLESANPETPDEIIAMITFADSPELQEQLRSLCREPNGYRKCRAIASHLDTILLKSKQPSARRSTNCWSSASSRNLRPVSGAKLTPYLKVTVNGD
jgi:hypothetical protein